MKYYFLLVLLVFGYSNIYAQKAPVKFGKLDESFVKMTRHPIDTSADAIILMDYGVLDFKYSTEDGFYFEFSRVTQIKIQTKDGLEYGDFVVPYYIGNTDKERVDRIKGITYNVVNKSIKASKLAKSSIFDEESSEHWRQMKISFPDVEVGSVVELTYTLTSPFIWNLTTWEFQNEIPTVYSEYRAAIPEYFNYQLLQSGYILLDVNERGSKQESISYQTKQRTGTNTLKTEFTNHNIEYRSNTYRWIAKDIQPFEPESYIASPSDYILKMDFELKSTKFPNSTYKEYMGSWQSLNKTFVESSSFMKAADQSGFIKDEVDLLAANENDIAKIDGLMKLIKQNMAWNGTYAKYASSNLRSAWNDHSGTTADINLILIAGLRRLGFNADPVLISTRGHGMIREQFAMSNQFNTVIALVETSEGNILLDATDPYLPSYALPVKCLNGKGWRVSETTWGFVNLNPTAKQEAIYQGKFEIAKDGMVSGNVTTVSKGYTAFSSYKNFKQKGEENFIESVKTSNPNWDVLDYTIDDSKGSAGPFRCVYEIELNENLLATGDRIYFNPTMGELLSKNPFKLENREYPVDFAQPLSDSYYFSFEIPEGYVVEDMPESAIWALPNKEGMFKYSVTVNGSVIAVVAQLKINKVKFVPTEYPALKRFYDMAVEKCAEQIVLKTKT